MYNWNILTVLIEYLLKFYCLLIRKEGRFRKSKKKMFTLSSANQFKMGFYLNNIYFVANIKSFSVHHNRINVCKSILLLKVNAKYRFVSNTNFQKKFKLKRKMSTQKNLPDDLPFYVIFHQSVVSIYGT